MNKRSALNLALALLVCAPLATWLARPVRHWCEVQRAAILTQRREARLTREAEYEVLTALIREADKSIRKYKTLKWHLEKLSNSSNDDIRSSAQQNLSKIRQAIHDTEMSRRESVELLEEVEQELSYLRHPGVNTMLLIVSVAFGALCVWLTVRIVNRRERWAKRAVAAVVGFVAECIG